MNIDPNGRGLFSFLDPITKPIGNFVNSAVNWVQNNAGAIIMAAVVVLAIAAVGIGIALSGGLLAPLLAPTLASTLASILIGAGIGTLLGGAYGGISAYRNGTDLVSGFVSGAITGAALGAAMPLAAFGATGFVVVIGTTFAAGMASYTVETVGNGREFNVGHMLLNGVSTAIQGTMLFSMSSLIGVAGIEGTLISRFISRAIGNQLGFVTDVSAQFFSGN